MGSIFNEMMGQSGNVRSPYARIENWLKQLGKADVERAVREAEAIFRRQGITFAVYGDGEASERLIPFDIIPRVFAAAEWRKLSAGIEQRVRTLNSSPGMGPWGGLMGWNTSIAPRAARTAPVPLRSLWQRVRWPAPSFSSNRSRVISGQASGMGVGCWGASSTIIQRIGVKSNWIRLCRGWISRSI